MCTFAMISFNSMHDIVIVKLVSMIQVEVWKNNIECSVNLQLGRHMCQNMLDQFGNIMFEIVSQAEEISKSVQHKIFPINTLIIIW